MDLVLLAAEVEADAFFGAAGVDAAKAFALSPATTVRRLKNLQNEAPALNLKLVPALHPGHSVILNLGVFIFSLQPPDKTRDRAAASCPCWGVITADARQLLARFKAGTASAEDVIRAFQTAPFADLGFANVDTHRSLRKGFAEVVFGSGKTPLQVAKIAERLLATEQQLLITRITAEHFRAVRRKFKNAIHHEAARCITIEKTAMKKRPGTIAVLSAGTSDLPVAEEAAVTAEVMGNQVERIFDVGVAGLHRLLARLEQFQKANVLIVVAGMEGALPSVVAGLVARPVIAVPTSVGYGAAFGGLAALCGMLTSCGSGVTVVNIDNGFGAGYAASQINALAADG